ncbi:MAG: glycosyltransferase family 2 protein [bacterium]|nr:glycosyltransferase family 2 protein [bacterium]
MRITIILPSLDEGPLLRQTVDASFRYLEGQQADVLIVTSARLTTPETRSVIEKLKTSYPGRVDSFDQTNSGLGSAAREAIERAQGDAIIFMAADMETPPEILPAIVEKLERGYDIVATNRWCNGITFNGYHPVKLVLAFIFQQIFRVLYLTHLNDLTHGYRAYKISVLKNIKWEETRHPFFFEAILKPIRLGYRIAEVDVAWETFSARKTSVGRAKSIDLFAYVRTGLRNRFLPKKMMLRDAPTPRGDNRYN